MECYQLCEFLLQRQKCTVRPYWSNTSSNSIVRTLVEQADLSVKGEIESLIEGKTITKPIHEDITYDDMNSTQDNLWNFLFFTGYLKKISEQQEARTSWWKWQSPTVRCGIFIKTLYFTGLRKKTKKKELSPPLRKHPKWESWKNSEILSENLMETISFYDYQKAITMDFLQEC